jgi:hypothetical protein
LTIPAGETIRLSELFAWLDAGKISQSL